MYPCSKIKGLLSSVGGASDQFQIDKAVLEFNSPFPRPFPYARFPSTDLSLLFPSAASTPSIFSYPCVPSYPAELVYGAVLGESPKKIRTATLTRLESCNIL